MSVVLSPTEGATGDDLLVIRDLIRDELENRGIAEPDVRVEGSNIVVDLPGVKDQRDALDAVDVAGIVTLRPVFACAAPPDDTSSTVPGSSVPGSASRLGPASTAAATSVAPTSTTPATPAGFGAPAGIARTAGAPPTSPPDAAASTTSAPPTTVPGASTTVPARRPPRPLHSRKPIRPCCARSTAARASSGPPGGAAENIFRRDSADVQLTQQEGWTVVVGLSGSGEAEWNALATQCFNRLETCPSGQLAIVLDDVIQSAPVVRQPQFAGDVSISGSFEEGEARSLARVLNRGAFPTDVEVLRVDTVSPTLGQDSMRASIFAGLAGVFLLLLLLIVFYRRLTLLIAAGMFVWGMLIYSVAVLISQTTNYALTLAGVTGIVVSIGMTVDSYVVYFERMKDEVLHGRTFKNSAGRAFTSTWRTILAANLVSFIAAAVLFVLSVGSVRGFALYLGVTTICDVIVLWFFTRPAVILMADTGRLDRHDQFGIGMAPARPAVEP